MISTASVLVIAILAMLAASMIVAFGVFIENAAPIAAHQEIDRARRWQITGAIILAVSFFVMMVGTILLVAAK